MRITRILCALSLFALYARAQSGNIVPSSGTDVPTVITDAPSSGNFLNPSGDCTTYNRITYNPLTGDIYGCQTPTFAQAGKWTRLNPTGGGAGAGTVTNTAGSLTSGHLVTGANGSDIGVINLTAGVAKLVNGVPSGASSTDITSLFSGTGQCLYSDGTKGPCGGGGGSAVWGTITGTLASQSDLNTALAGKQATGTYMTGLSGDVSAAGPGIGTATVARVNGTSVATASGTDQTLVTASTISATWRTLPSCTDSGGQHLNYDTVTHTFSCGSTGGGAGGGTVTNTSGALTTARLIVGSGGNDIASSNLTLSVAKFTSGVPSAATGTDVAAAFSGSGQCLYSDGTKGACGGSAVWGAITGTLSSQTDLNAALSGKQSTGNYITVLTGDVTATGPGTVAGTVARVNGTTVPTNSAADQTIVTTASATGAWKALPSCADTGGNHLNYDTTAHAFSCGTSGGGGGGGAATSIQTGTLAGASATPAVGYLYQATDVTVGPQIYTATAANTLVQLIVLGATGGLSWGGTNNQLDINTAIVPRLAFANSFTGSNTFGGTTALTNATCSGTCTGFGGAGASFYQTVKNAGVAATQRAALNFTGTGFTVSDDAAGGQTTVNFTGGGGGGFTGTAGSIPFVGAGGTLTETNTALFWDNSQHRIGIGTNAPTVSLDIIDSSPKVAIRGNGTTNTTELRMDTTTQSYGWYLWPSSSPGNLPGSIAFVDWTAGGGSIRSYLKPSGEWGFGGSPAGGGSGGTLAGAFMVLGADGKTATFNTSAVSGAGILLELTNTSTGGSFDGNLAMHWQTPTRNYYGGLGGAAAGGTEDTMYLFDATGSSFVYQLKDAQWKIIANLQLQPGAARPTCNSANRGTHYYTNAGAGTADIEEVCRKDAVNAYGWQAVW
jgi:hypothetical protein